jgi:hypothetical protein
MQCGRYNIRYTAVSCSSPPHSLKDSRGGERRGGERKGEERMREERR